MILKLKNCWAWGLRAVCAALTVISPAAAQPSGPVTLLVGFPAAGSADAAARAVADKVAAALGVAVVVENRPGAGDRIAAEAMKNAAPDGNTVNLADLVNFYKANPSKANFGTSAAGSVGEGWMGAYMHAKTAPATVQRISAALADAAGAPDVKARLEAAGLEPAGLRMAEFAAVVAADTARWKPVIEASGFRGD